MQKNNINKKTYNAIAQTYYKEACEDHEDKTYINYFLHDLPGDDILDLGCGPGILSKYLTDLGYNVTGVDFAEDMISIAKKLVPNANFIISDI